MEEEPEDMSIGIVRSVSSVFSGLQWDRRERETAEGVGGIKARRPLTQWGKLPFLLGPGTEDT
jgi:hypothetical protein